MNNPKHKLRLIFAHNGVDTFDPLFVSQLSNDFETYFFTFLRPTRELEGAIIVKLPDFGKPLRVRKLNNLRIALGMPWRVFQMRHYLAAISPDVVIGNWVTTYGLYMWLTGKRPFVLFAYGSDIVLDPHRSIFHKLITTKIVRSADIVLIDSDVQHRALLSLGCSPRKIVSFPWFDLAGLRSVERNPKFRRKMGWAGNRIVVSVRKHEPTYAIDTLILAIPAVLASAPNVRFLIFGSGTQTPTLMKLVRELSVENFVHFAGNVPRRELLRYMKDCDIYVSTSLSDGCSSSLLEAMSLGLPPIVTEIPGNTEWVKRGVNGITFQKNAPQELAAAIVELSSNSTMARGLAQNAKTEVRVRVNWRRSMKGLVDRIYETRETYAVRQDQLSGT